MLARLHRPARTCRVALSWIPDFNYAGLLELILLIGIGIGIA